MKIFIIVMISYYEFNKLHMEYLLIKGFSMEY